MNTKKRYLAFSLLAGILLSCAVVGAQELQYQLVSDWAKIPGGAWGVMAAVGTDAKGNVYAFQRADSAKVMVFDPQGNFLREWGSDVFEFPHGLTVGTDGSVWVCDKKREQVLKFNAQGKLLMTIGQKDIVGNEASHDAFNGLANVAVARNGDIFIADGENSAPGVPPYDNRIVKFSSEGTFLKSWGTKGDEPGNFNVPHSIAIDPEGRVWVGDRNNKRIEMFDADGRLLKAYTQFGQPSSIYIAKNGTVYVGTKESIIVGKTDGTILTTIENVPDPHGIAVDENTGAIYVAQVGPKAVLKYVKK